MEYIRKVRIPASVKEEKYDISPCIKCDCEDIELTEYDDEFGYISDATCKKCKQNIKVTAGIIVLIHRWNKENNIKLVIENLTKVIQDSKAEIIELKKKQKLRDKEAKKSIKN